MSGQARLSRHASGILPSKQFFAPRKPVLHAAASVRRKPTYTINSNRNNVPAPLLAANGATTLLGTIPSSPTEGNGEENAQSSIPLQTLSSQQPPAHSLDSQQNQEISHRQQLQTQGGPPSSITSIDDIPQSVIDSVLEPVDLDSTVMEPNVQHNLNVIKSLAQKRASLAQYKKQQAKAISAYASIEKLLPRIVYIPPTLPSEKANGRKRLYQVWPGRNRFFLNGRIMTSRDSPAFIVAFLTLVVPCSLFLVFTGPYLYVHVSPAVVFAFGYLFLLALISMLRTSWTDPGIIPRNLDPSPPTEELDDSNIQNVSQHPYSPIRSAPLPKDVKLNGATLILKYCETCRIYRPPRSSHCRQCDNCVEGEDHHCIWLNNCIGRRNYRSFYTLIVTSTILCLCVLSFSIVHLVLLMQQKKLALIRVLITAPVSFVLALVAFFLVWSVGGLTIYHTYLVCSNMTTHEQLRAPLQRGNVRNPYDFRNVFANCSWVLCRPSIHSTVRRRTFAGPEHWREDEILGCSEYRTSSEPVKPLRCQQIKMTTTTTTTTVPAANLTANGEINNAAEMAEVAVPIPISPATTISPPPGSSPGRQELLGEDVV